MNGEVNARRNLGCLEVDAGNENRAMKHFLLASNAGDFTPYGILYVRTSISDMALYCLAYE